eukprot:g22449.t1
MYARTAPGLCVQLRAHGPRCCRCQAAASARATAIPLPQVAPRACFSHTRPAQAQGHVEQQSLQGSSPGSPAESSGTCPAVHATPHRPKIPKRALQTGTVYGWGSDTLGGLEKDYAVDIAQYPAHPIPSLHDVRIKSITASFYTSLAIDCIGRVFQWGWRPHLRSLTKAVRSRRRWGRLMPKLQTLYLPAWLNNSYASAPALVEPFGATPALRATQVAAGGEFALALTAAGTVYSWHTGFYGQLGHGGTWTDMNLKQPRQ